MTRLLAVVLLSGCCGHAALEQRVAALERVQVHIDPTPPSVYDDLIPPYRIITNTLEWNRPKCGGDSNVVLTTENCWEPK